MKLITLKHKKGWFRLILVTSPVSGVLFIVLEIFNTIEWYKDDIMYYIPGWIINLIVGGIAHIIFSTILLLMIMWIRQGFRE